MRVVHLFVWILAFSIAGSVSTAVAQNKSSAPSGSQATGIAPVSGETRSLAEQRTRARTQLKDAISGDNNTWVAAERAHEDLLKSAHRANDQDAVGDAINGLIALYLSAPSQLSAPQLFAKVHAATKGVPIPKSAQQLLAKNADAIYSTTVRFAEAGAGPYRCRSEAKPAVRALLVGNKSYTNRNQPLGPFNDVEVAKGAWRREESNKSK